MLHGQTGVVTGASSGIGRALALALAREGARVFAIARGEDRLHSLAEEAGEHTGAVVPLVADLEREDDVRAASRHVRSDADAVHLLVHAAGAISLGGFETISREALDSMLSVNLRAPVLLTQLLLPALRSAQGQVVFVNSLAADFPSSENAVYAATKRGLAALADGLRAEVNADGVRVVTAYVGRTATPMQEFVHENEGRPYRPELLLQTEDVVRLVLEALALPRTGELTDLRVRPARKLS